jgi:hypothetical protein
MAKKLMKGNEAIAEAAIQAGCRFFFGYPITPQNEIPEYMARRMPQVVSKRGHPCCVAGQLSARFRRLSGRRWHRLVEAHRSARRPTRARR